MSTPMDNNYGWFWFGVIMSGKSNSLAQSAHKYGTYIRNARDNEKENYTNRNYGGNNNAITIERSSTSPEIYHTTASLSEGTIGNQAAQLCRQWCLDPLNKYYVGNATRMMEHWFDCASLVSRVYYSLGMTQFYGSDGEAKNTEGLAKLFIDNKCIVMINCFDFDLLRPGDIILSCRQSLKRAHINYVNHAFMYLGGDQFGEANTPGKNLEIHRKRPDADHIWWITARPNLMLQGIEGLTMNYSTDFMTVSANDPAYPERDTVEILKTNFVRKLISSS